MCIIYDLVTDRPTAATPLQAGIGSETAMTRKLPGEWWQAHSGCLPPMNALKPGPAWPTPRVDEDGCFAARQKCGFPWVEEECSPELDYEVPAFGFRKIAVVRKLA